MDTIAPSVLMGSSSDLQVTRTCISYRTSSISDQIELFALGLRDLERRKCYSGENVLDTITTLFLSDHPRNFTGYQDNNKISEEFRPHPSVDFGVTCP